MKVLKKKPQPSTQIECECGVVLEFTDEDIQTNSRGEKYITCPECHGNPIWLMGFDTVEEPDEKILTIDNIQFPEDFYQFGKSKSTVKIDDEEINERIQKCLKNLKADKKDYGIFHYIGSGDSIVIVVKHEDEYVVFVCKDYYEAAIDR